MLRIRFFTRLFLRSDVRIGIDFSTELRPVSESPAAFFKTYPPFGTATKILNRMSVTENRTAHRAFYGNSVFLPYRCPVVSLLMIKSKPTD